MPEGHTLHRLAEHLTAAFGSEPVAAASPQGRFAAGAALIDGRAFETFHAHGKHLFGRLSPDEFLHIHLGLIGGFAITGLAAGEPVPPPVGAVRLRLVGPRAYADLRGATVCEMIDGERYVQIVGGLGPDPLTDNPDGSAAWARIHRSRLPIGRLLMDQSVLSGVGNVYRAEVLFRAGLSPMTPGNRVQRAEWDAIWADLVTLMRSGRTSGRIDTVADEFMPDEMGRPARVDRHGGEVYVYRRAGEPCFVCGAQVRTEVLAGRNLFWCPTCQRRGARRK